MNKFLAISFIFLMACESDKEKSALATKKNEVMKVHDDAMDKMGELTQLSKKLSSKLQEDSAQNEVISKAIADLEEAEELMWNWMRGYKYKIVDTSAVDKAMEYLLIQEEKIKIVEEKINTSIQNAKELL